MPGEALTEDRTAVVPGSGTKTLGRPGLPDDRQGRSTDGRHQMKFKGVCVWGVGNRRLTEFRALLTIFQK